MSQVQHVISETQPDWTPTQKTIISAPSDQRILVVAGPGTGKTAVACARVAHLAEQGINPTNILMFSFTRAAVSVLRDRIKNWSSNPEVASVKIATLDSTAWFFRLGAGEDVDNRNGSFEENIEKCIELLAKRDPVIQDYLEQTQHILIDETQDLTGARSRLVAELLSQIPSSCGVTVFGDPAQAIYGFTNDTEDNVHDNSTFLEQYPFSERGYIEHELKEIHRTEQPDILRLISETRARVYPGHEDESKRPAMVLESVQKYSVKTECEFDEESDLEDEDLVLSRKRAQAMQRAHFYPHPYRLRISNMPVCIHPWIGAVFWNYTEPTVGRSRFGELWDESVEQVVWDSISADEAWAILDHHCGGQRNSVNLTRLRILLSRPRPHSDFCLPDFGLWGPVFGTIHAAKGREADRVVLMLPNKAEHATAKKDDTDADRKNAEEARVYYVGATRAKETFEFGIEKTLKGTGRTNKGRVFRKIHGNNTKCSVQIGQSGDLDETALFRRDLCLNKSDAERNLKHLLSSNHHFLNEEEQCVPIRAKLENTGTQSDAEWKYRFFVDHESTDCQIPIGWSNASLGYDLFQVGDILQDWIGSGKLNPPSGLRYLKALGLRTIAIDPQTTGADQLYEPFASSGFMLAPMVFGFPPAFFRPQKNSK